MLGSTIKYLYNESDVEENNKILKLINGMTDVYLSERYTHKKLKLELKTLKSS